jgi:hypothetical protein
MNSVMTLGVVLAVFAAGSAEQRDDAAKAAASAGVLEKRRPGPRDWNRC